MKKIQTWNVGRWRRKGIEILAMGHTLVLLIMGSALLFVVLGLGGLAENRLQTSPVSSMKGLAGSVSSGFFADMLGMEVPHLAQKKQHSSLSGEQWSPFVFQMLTGINPQDPKSLISREIPGMAAGAPVLLRKGSGNIKVEGPTDYQPDQGTTDTPGSSNAAENPPSTTPDIPTAPETDPAREDDPGDAAKGEKRILIYHSHPREAYNPLLSKTSSNPNSGSKSANVSRVGDFVKKRLEKQGISTLHVNKDYATTVQNYNWNYSYKYSRTTVKEALAQNKGLTYLLDIHRDSQRHGKTTATINGLSYAKVYFIIGHDNKNWRKNEAFAARIHEKLEKSYHGVSRGVWGKDGGKGNNGEYNQSLSSHSILIEIGGIDNTEEELKRTSDVLADMISEVYWEDQKAQKAGTNVSDTKKSNSGN
ncbi:stage II sporulation protein P [Paenibacillus polymyxa]|uniref:stage II sporulation protein P n=1 Tax=Paenibacillus polymyxa TaxID=1406 RepID=UPI002023D590|nr:stage II sporulation protein P [Paenibacillus polymyxa]MDU8672147.1 stage II sporulation protein P [Paenibacillus polymyxa]MDU8697056.1 stage II sporulation protein P [Paenibacillus polymyxa]URJ56241.3 stage II sporulation protein P [Paenibacillus polymyxa]URJ70751.1 stage II sporulation protein P [Paenibacillus polymyxa]WDZ61428.1 stage II sporulation protein P [Paenibacillus polymyxa]